MHSQNMDLHALRQVPQQRFLHVVVLNPQKQNRCCKAERQRNLNLSQHEKSWDAAETQDRRSFRIHP